MTTELTETKKNILSPTKEEEETVDSFYPN